MFWFRKTEYSIHENVYAKTFLGQKIVLFSTASRHMIENSDRKIDVLRDCNLASAFQKS